MAANDLAIAPIDAIDDARGAWASAAEALGNPFMTPEWGDAWLAHVAPGLDVRQRLFGGYRPDGSLAAIIPLVVGRGRFVRKARLLGFGPANRLGPISAPADELSAAQALRAALWATSREWDLFVGDNLGGGSDWAARLGAKAIRRDGSPEVSGSWAGWDDYLATRSGNFRQELRRKERRLAEQDLRYTAVSHSADLDGALDLLFELHRARWGADASPWFAGQEPFHRAFARAAFERGWLRLRTLEVNGKPVAAYYGLRLGAAEWSYQFGRDPDAGFSSVGLIMTAHAVREALADGATRFELGPGAQTYKLRFATSDPGVETVGVPRSIRGRAALAAARRRP